MSTVFSQMIAGEHPCFQIFEDEWTFAFLTRDSIQLGHSLIVPKVEVDYFIDVPEPYYSKVFTNSRLIARAIHNVTNCIRVGTLSAGWDIPHFHYHLVPMSDYYDLDPTRARIRTREKNLKMQADLRAEIKKLSGQTSAQD